MTDAIALYSDLGCPFGQRLEALLRHLAVPFRLERVHPKRKPAALLALSPTGRIPLVTIGAAVLYETSVVADLLAREHGWRDAYPADPLVEACHRAAIRRLEVQWPGDARPSDARTEEDLGALEALVADDPLPLVPTMLTLAAAPLWLRWNGMEGHLPTDITARIRARPALLRWFDAAAELDVIRATTPDPAEVRIAHGVAVA